MNNVPDFHSIIESDDIGYQSPIEVILQRMQTKIEDCMKAVQRYGFNINKEELEKALRYDRDQYRKGYEAARIQYARPKGKWEMKENEYIRALICSECRSFTMTAYNFCPSCGADMRKEGEP